MRKRLRAGLFFLLALVGAAGQVMAQDKVVLGIEGDWWDEGGKRLGFASPVTGTCVFGMSGSLQVGASSDEAQAFIYERMPAQCPEGCRPRGWTVPSGSHCDKWTGKKDAVTQASAASSSGIASFFQHLLRSPQLYVVAAARGLEEEPREAVVPWKASEVDLAPTLQPLASGTYAITLEPLDGKAKAIAGKVVWAGESAAATLNQPGLHAGLYKLTVALEGGDSEGSEAWVLLSTPTQYALDLRDFQQMTAITERWGERVDASGKRALLRACLQTLYERNMGKQP